MKMCELCGHEHEGDFMLFSKDHQWDSEDARRAALQKALDAVNAAKAEIKRLQEKWA